MYDGHPTWVLPTSYGGPPGPCKTMDHWPLSPNLDQSTVPLACFKRGGMARNGSKFTAIRGSFRNVFCLGP